MVPNRKGIVASFPVDKKQTLGSVMATIIPYEYNKIFNTRAYFEGEKYEIRNYGKVTVGRAGIKKEEFFEYMNTNHPDLVFLDEEDKPYIKCYEYMNEITKDEFSKQTFKLTQLLNEFKRIYR